MIDLVLAVFFVGLLTSAIVALEVRDLLASAVVLSGFSFLMALLYALLLAVDVGFNEAVLGAGVTGVLFVVAVARTARRTGD